MVDSLGTPVPRAGASNALSPSLLNLIVDTSSYPTIIIDHNLSIVHFNRDAEEVLRMTRPKGPRPGSPLEDYLPGESCETLRTALGRCSLERGTSSESKVAVDVTGKRYPVVVMPVGLLDDVKKVPTQAYLVMVKMEGRGARDQQAVKLASLGEFAAGIAHELNTPLASISLIAENLLDDVKDEAIKKELRKILTQVEFSAKTVQEILAFARKDNPSFELVDLSKVLNDSIEKLHLERKWRLRFDIQPGLPKIKADPFQLQDVFINIIRNAKEAEKEGGEIAVRLFANEDWVVADITDTGEGIPKENLVHIFQPFFTTKPHGQGIGLGLSICQRIILNHKGELHVTSEVGKGTTFTIRLPRGDTI
jgi:signal transduction histidine kinase